LRHLLPLGLGQGGPRRAYRQASHGRDIKGLADDRRQLREPSALPERPAVLHRAEQRVIKAPGRYPLRWRASHKGVGEERQGERYGEVCNLRADILRTMTRPSAINDGSPLMGVAMRVIGICIRIELCSTLTSRNRLKLDIEMSNAHQSSLVRCAQPVAKGFSLQGAAEVEPPAAR